MIQHKNLTSLGSISTPINMLARDACRLARPIGIKFCSYGHVRLNVSSKVKLQRSIDRQITVCSTLYQRTSNNVLETIRAESAQALQKLQRSIEAPTSSAPNEATSASQAILKSKLQMAITKLQQGLIERDTEVRLLLLAAMAGEHILLIGPPGTAKSEVGRRLSRFIRGSYFERLLTRFSVPEELFGPLSMRALEEDRYVRQTQGYLPEAEVAFVDEIFKANSAILNSLLTLLNERLFDNGCHREQAPLVTMVGASNELPEGEELEALFDRFLLRRTVSQISPAGLSQLLSQYSGGAASSSSAGGGNASADAPAEDAEDSRLLMDDMRECRREALRRVRVPESVLQVIVDLREYLQNKMEPPVYVSDRRVLKAMQLLQVAAFCDGRAEVSNFDLLLLQHIFWRQPEQAAAVAEWLVGQLTVDFGTKQLQFLLSALFGRVCKSLGDADEVDAVKRDAAQLKELVCEKLVQAGGKLLDSNDLWIGPEVVSLAMSLEPRLAKTRERLQTVLRDLLLLEASLRHDVSPVTLAALLPKLWADFIRNSDIDEVLPIGTVPLGKK